MGKVFGSVILAAGLAHAQSNATIHGHVQNPAGQAVRSAAVKLTTDKTANKDKTYKFSFTTDANGDFKGADITPGDYLAVVVAEGKTADFQEISLKAGDDKTVNFDMTREEYLKSMSAEDRATLEEYKKKNAAAAGENAKIANINKVLLQALDDEKNGKPDVAVAELKPLVDAKPNEPIVWSSLGQAELQQAAAQAKAAGDTKAIITNPDALASYTDAATNYQKAIELASAPSAKPNPDNLAAFYLNLGQALGKMGKLTEAGAAYETSAKTSPTRAGSAFYNESVVFYTNNKMPEANAAADKAIAADPKRADAYYIKAQSLIGGATMDAKTNKFVLPPGCLESYQEYLELAPEGSHAAEVKDLLNNLGQPVKNSFKAAKPH
jgi:tetratricopeptide (TPR) repeat protein